jgi:CheY-like chemotaxis protein
MLPLGYDSVKNWGSTSMARLFLTGRDWQFRALLRAQVIEEGVEVEAYESPREALNSLSSLRDLPPLLLADLSQSPNPEAEIDLLSRWRKLLPTWVVLPQTFKVERDLQEIGIERILLKPIDVKKLISEIKERLGASPQSDC